MRLSDFEETTIVNAVRSRFGSETHVYLFGSRIDDAVKGGDIDLLVDLPVVNHKIVQRSCQVIADIQMTLGEQKIDLVVRHPDSASQPIFHEALTHGILLA
ncbi:MAG: nucleotidyltransferase domain-containing protein [Mariprofundaceae bacterium]